MTHPNEAQAPAADKLEALEKQLSKALGKDLAPSPLQGRASYSIAHSHELTVKDGKETLIDRTKPLGGHTATATPATRPGFVNLPGVGLCEIKAAIAGGLLPEGWTPEQGFDKPAEGKAGSLAGNQDAARSEAEDKEQSAPNVTPAMQAAVTEAGRILDQVDQTHGAGVTDRYLSEIAETGEIPTEALPDGITEATIQTVYDGYVAQCNASLAEVGASVTMLENMLDADHLRVARQATLRQDKEVLKELGRLAQGRLATLPEKDPEAFAAMLEGMPPKEREALHLDPGSRRWTVRIPGQPEMSFAAAVKLKLVRF